MHKLPESFVWTKVQAEGGQLLTEILARKELERATSGGVFFWGVGNALGDRVRLWVESVARPTVVFSLMKAPPRPEDRDSEEVFAWLSYVDGLGQHHRVPDTVIVTSRAATATRTKHVHYALVCHAEAPLGISDRGTINLGHYRNFLSESPRIGGSQVTAVVQFQEQGAPGGEYSVGMLADLRQPYFVRLATPVLLTKREFDAVRELSGVGTTPTVWRENVTRLHDAWTRRSDKTKLTPLLAGA